MKLATRLLVYILGTSLVVLLFVISLLGYKQYSDSVAYTKTILDQSTRVAANGFKADLESNLVITRTMSTFFSEYKTIPVEQRIDLVNSYQRNLLNLNLSILSVGTSWEYNLYDQKFEGWEGRFLTGYFREDGKIKYIERNFNGDSLPATQVTKKLAAETIETYANAKNAPNETKGCVASISTPIFTNKVFVGMTNIEISLASIQGQIYKINPLGRSKAFVIDEKGKFIINTDTTYTFKNLEALFINDSKYAQVREKLSNGEAFQTTLRTKNDETYYITICPILLTKLNNSWAVGIFTPVEDIHDKAAENLPLVFLLGILAFITLSIVIYVQINRVVNPIKSTTKVVAQLATGAINQIERMSVETDDEIGKIRNSINLLIESMKSTVEFAQKVGEGNFQAEYKKLGEYDTLGSALLDMRQNLLNAEEEDNKRSIEELKFNWATEGMASVGEILRFDHDDLPKLCGKLIGNLVRHIRANQGGIYYLERKTTDDKAEIKLMAHFAFNKAKIEAQSFEVNEGLVGEAIRKNETIHLDNVPNSYMNISSGLGHVTPRNVLILPISKEDRVFGAIELSSFKTFEPHQIEFLNKLGQSIGGTFDSIEASIRTQMLLKESQQQRELLIEHEQNLMLNLEKVEHIQRTTAKREAELKSILKALHNIAPVTEYNMDGEIIFANRVLLNLLERPEAYLLGKKQGSLRLNQTEEPYEDFWKDLKRGITKYDLQHIRVGEKDLWLSGAFTPILDENGIPYKVLNISTNITYQKQLELQIQHFEAQTSKDADAQ